MAEIKPDCSETREEELYLESINLMMTKQDMEHQNTGMQVKNLPMSVGNLIVMEQKPVCL